MHRTLYIQVLAAIARGIAVRLPLPERRRCPQTARRRLHRADQDDDRAGDLLHCRAWDRRHGMRKGIEVRLGPGDRERLETIVGSGNSPQKHVWRSRIVMLSADGIGTMAIQRQTGKSKPTIWRWQARFMAEGVDGLLHDATRPAGKPPLPGATIER